MTCTKRCFETREDAIRTARAMYSKKKAILTPYSCYRHEKKAWHLTNKTKRYRRDRKR